jgi:hypothetical protein
LAATNPASRFFFQHARSKSGTSQRKPFTRYLTNERRAFRLSAWDESGAIFSQRQSRCAECAAGLSSLSKSDILLLCFRISLSISRCGSILKGIGIESIGAVLRRIN